MSREKKYDKIINVPLTEDEYAALVEEKARREEQAGMELAMSAVARAVLVKGLEA